MNKVTSLEDLLMHHLQNLYAAETHQLAALPTIINKAHHSSLKNALTHHLGLTADHKKRLEKIFELLKSTAVGNETFTKTTLDAGYVCKGMMGLVDEATELLEGGLAGDVTDAAIIACVQKMEHYEICTYGTTLAYAIQLQQHKVELLLKETLDEEYDADDLLTALATAALNKEAISETLQKDENAAGDNYNEGLYTGGSPSHKASSSERTINSPGGRAGTSHRRYPSGESRGH